MSDEDLSLSVFIEDIDGRLMKKIRAQDDMSQWYDFFNTPTQPLNPRMFLAYWGSLIPEEELLHRIFSPVELMKFKPKVSTVAETEKYAEVHNLVVNAMQKQDIATYNDEAVKGMDLIADKTTRDILALFGEK